MSIDTKDKIYFAYTPFVAKGDGTWGWIDDNFTFTPVDTARATVALQKIGDTIHYGVTVCSAEDNFNKKEGRALAERRLKAGYGKFDIPVDLAKDLKFKDEHALCLYFLRNMVNSIEKDIRKVQFKIGKKKMPPRGPYLLHSSIGISKDAV